jgi:hypothetical protein
VARKKANKQVDEQRLKEAFATFKKDEPFVVTKQRTDRAKGFKDTSPEGRSLSSIKRMQNAKDPKNMFYHFEDGFHTPATKQPKHETFVLNDPRRQAVARAMYPKQKRSKKLSKETTEQYLDIVSGRKHGKKKNGKS